MDEPLPARTPNEARYYLMVTRCDACGKGPWIVESQTSAGRPGDAFELRARCRGCGAAKAFRFLREYDVPDDGAESECINPADSPSRLVDLGQWLSLFYLLIETAADDDSGPGVRRSGFRASLCLAEALKFYGDDELPPQSAFFSETTIAAFREHPEKFARQKLRDMQAKLPTLPVMARRIARDERSARRRWWPPWRK